MKYKGIYDNNGNVTSNQFRDISGITYNISNLPEQLTANDSLVKYWYDNNSKGFRKEEWALDEIYILDVIVEAEELFDIKNQVLPLAMEVYFLQNRNNTKSAYFYY